MKRNNSKPQDSAREQRRLALDKADLAEAPRLRLLRLSDWVAHLSALVGLLSEDERHKAERYRSDDDRASSIIGRACLRLLLGRCLGVPPRKLLIDAGAHGKPHLRVSGETSQAMELHFNLSHSHEQVIIGISQSGALGVDIECRSSGRDFDRLCRRFFAREETEYVLRAGDDIDLRYRFFRVWCGKEAYLKGLGLGLSVELDSFYLASPSAHSSQIVRGGKPETGLVRFFEPDQAYQAAVFQDRSPFELDLSTLRPEDLGLENG